jgi:hypothetical protein
LVAAVVRVSEAGPGPDDPQVRNERRLHLLHGERIGELRALTNEQVREKYDAHVDEARSSRKQGVRLVWLERAQVYADELARREASRQGERMEALTESLNRLTWWIVFLTVVAVLVGIVGAAVAAMTFLSG